MGSRHWAKLSNLSRADATLFAAAARPMSIVPLVSRFGHHRLGYALVRPRAFTASLLELPPAAEIGDGPEPDLHNPARAPCRRAVGLCLVLRLHSKSQLHRDPRRGHACG